MDIQLENVQQNASSVLDDCLKLLKGERDEQRIAGLLLVTKVCKGDDLESLRRVYASVGTQFLNRLFMTGVGKIINESRDGEDNQEAYFQLVVPILAAFCRDPDIASSSEMVSKIRPLLEAMPTSRLIIAEDCYEFLYLVTSSSKNGAQIFYDSGGMKTVALQLRFLVDGSYAMELAIKLIYVVLSKITLESNDESSVDDLSSMVPIIARQFAVLHNLLKFEALYLLSHLFSSWKSDLFHESLRKNASSKWPEYIRHGIVDILQNYLEHSEKLCALILANSVVSFLGNEWLIGLPSERDVTNPWPHDRCLLLVLETSRIEIAVLLNELAYKKHDMATDVSKAVEDVCLMERNLGTVFSLVEVVIKLIAEQCNDEGKLLDDKTLIKMINGLNETVSVVMDYLKDAKEHGTRKGNDLLASVRLVGCYLSETPDACEEKVSKLLDYMLLVEGEDEIRPFQSICFILPMLCQRTTTISGCKTLVSIEGHKAVIGCLVKLIEQSDADDNAVCRFLACDILLNLLLKNDELRLPMRDPSFISLLNALGMWTANFEDLSIVMMASCLCASIFCGTSEEALLKDSNFSSEHFHRLSQCIARCILFYEEGVPDFVEADVDLLEIIVKGYPEWSKRFPTVTGAVANQRKLSSGANSISL